MPHRLRVSNVVAGLVALAACADRTIAPVPPRHYGLVTIGGARLPVLLDATAAESTYVLAAAIDLDQFGRAMRWTTTQRIVGGVRRAQQTLADTVAYAESGGRIEIGVYHCTGPVACPHGVMGTIDATWLRLTPDASPTTPAWVYARLLQID